MELKDFQQNVLDSLDQYLGELVKARESAAEIEKLRQEKPHLAIPASDFTKQAWETLAERGMLPKSRDPKPFSPRTDGAGRSVPSVTLKIPTGGGKTLLAAHSVSRLMGAWLRANHGLVLWIVPNESIYSQTRKALINREHPYRQALDRAAAGRVKILDKTSPLSKRDVESHLCVMLLMLQSSNRQNKDTLRIFKDRGNVRGFFPDGDDPAAHFDLLGGVPNLDVYGDKHSLGCVVKDSLGNALRAIRPIVVMDEGHKAFSKLAIDTLYGFNPCFVLELSATPADRDRDVPPVYSNWLVDVRGTDLDKEEMIKLPISVTRRAGDDWRDCLRAAFEHLNELQTAADSLRGRDNRYIRPICLVQVERTGREQREMGLIHAEDAREHLLMLGAREQQIAIKTSETNDLKEPENQDLLSPENEVRFIITKQALQEGWDCPFAYVLCSLAPNSSRNAMTQLIGRVLRQPDTRKTGVAALDQCYVFCFHVNTVDIVEGIKKGLERDGLSDLADRIQEDSESSGWNRPPRTVRRRESYRNLKIYLPIVNWVCGEEVRPLDYEEDILFRIDWNQANIDSVVEAIPMTAHARDSETHRIQIQLSDSDSTDFLATRDLGGEQINRRFDPVYAVRSIVDIVSNPWVAREIVAAVVAKLGFDEEKLGAVGHLLIDNLRAHLAGERDRLAEALFMEGVSSGQIQFRLRADRNNWVMPEEIFTQRDPNSQLLRGNSGETVRGNLFESVYIDDFNGYEKSVACYLDGEKALRWWHRNVARQQYALQGWRKNKIYPDFIFSMDGDDGNERIMILETKGEHLDNPDTKYKHKVMETCAKAYQYDGLPNRGELELVVDGNVSVSCDLIFEGQWESSLSKLLEAG